MQAVPQHFLVTIFYIIKLVRDNKRFLIWRFAVRLSGNGRVRQIRDRIYSVCHLGEVQLSG